MSVFDAAITSLGCADDSCPESFISYWQRTGHKDKPRTAEHISVQTLADRFAVSEITVRRDLAHLESEGKLKRLRGGAKATVETLPHRLAGQPAFADAQRLQLAQKRAIGALAAQLVSPGESIIIDSGTTTWAMADHLRELRVQVLTSSLPVAERLVCSESVRIILLGGHVYPEQKLVLSAFDTPIVECYSAATLFMSALAIGPQGVLQSHPLLVKAQRRLRERADQLVVLADHSKFSPACGNTVYPLDEIDTLITDDGVAPDAIAMLEDAGVKVLVAQTPKQRRSRK